MKALVKTRPEPGLELVEVPDPVAGPNDVIVKVMRTGICGTDVHIDKWDGWAAKTVHTPLVLGHEFCGQIVELGSEVNDLEVGQFVSGEGHYVCGRCRACLAGKRHLCRNTQGIGYAVDGAYCQYFVMPAGNVWVHHIPDLDPDVAAIFDPFGNAVHTALQFPAWPRMSSFQVLGRSASWRPWSLSSKGRATSSLPTCPTRGWSWLSNWA